MFDAVFDLARSGQGYPAIERSSLVLRKLKRANQQQDAFINMMTLANILLDSGQPLQSGTAANRAVRIFPKDHKLDDAMKSTISSFALRVPHEASSPDLNSFFQYAVTLMNDSDFQLRTKHAQITDAANSYTPAQFAYIKLIAGKLEKEQPVEPDLDHLYSLLHRWVDSIPDPRIKIFTSQFIFIRPLFMILSAGSPETVATFGAAAQYFYTKISQDPKLRGLPLTLFGKLMVRSVIQANSQAFTEVTQLYNPLLAKSVECGHWTKTLWTTYFSTDPNQGQFSLANLGTLVNQVLGNLTANTA
jgi:hypothetical protein